MLNLKTLFFCADPLPVGREYGDAAEAAPPLRGVFVLPIVANQNAEALADKKTRVRAVFSAGARRWSTWTFVVFRRFSAIFWR